jgi:hypothetical protein
VAYTHNEPSGRSVIRCGIVLVTLPAATGSIRPNRKNTDRVDKLQVANIGVISRSEPEFTSEREVETARPLLRSNRLLALWLFFAARVEDGVQAPGAAPVRLE